MLPLPTLTVIDRLIATLMTLVDAIYPVALNGSTSTFPEHAAQTLFLRLSHLIATLIRISNFGIRAHTKPATTPNRTPPAPLAQRPSPSPAQTLPRRPGWLLAALPDLAPAIAADLAALLADPALTTLLANAPTLHRTLRPLLRSLDLADTEPPPSPHPVDPPPVPEPPPIAEPGPATPSQRHPAANPAVPKIHLSHPIFFHAHFVTI